MGEPFRKKSLIIIITMIFILMSIFPLTGSAKLEKQVGDDSSFPDYQITLNRDPDVYPVFNGTIGETGWFISPVNVTFVYDPQIVKTIFYDYNGIPEEYTGLFIIFMQGRIFFQYGWEDYEGNVYGDYTICLAIDYTPPAIAFLTPEKNTCYFFGKKLLHLNGLSIIIGQITIDVAAADEYAGLTNVTFVFTKGDTSTINVIYPGPYEWTLTGRHIGTYTLSATAYNCAGLHTITTLKMRMLQFV